MSIRDNVIHVRLSDTEKMFLEAAAEISNPTANGVNLARAIRQGAIRAAIEVLMRPIKKARNLRDLCSALNDYGDMIHRLERSDGELIAAQMHADAGHFLPELPTFGGSEPSDTSGIWSWDKTHLLVGEGWDHRLVERESEPEEALPVDRFGLRVVWRAEGWVLYSDEEYADAIPARYFDRPTTEEDYYEWCQGTRTADEPTLARLAWLAGKKGVNSGAHGWVEADGGEE